MSVQPVTRQALGVGFLAHEVIVESVTPEQNLATCREASTQRLLDVRLVPLRVRMPQVGERWIVDITLGTWTFAALLRSEQYSTGTEQLADGAVTGPKLAPTAVDNKTLTGVTIVPYAKVSLASVGYVNGWVKYNDPNWTDPFYQVTHDGWVRMGGLLSNPVGTTTGTIVTLPAPLRPPLNTLYSQQCAGGTCRVDVNSNGTVLLTGYNAGNAGYVSLDGIAWSLT